MWEVLVTGALRTGERLHRGGIVDQRNGEVFEPTCVLCDGGHVETIHHVFLPMYLLRERT